MADIGIKLGVDGEKSFNDALKNINSTLKVLGSEMKEVSSRFLDNSKSIEAYNEKNKILSRQIETQKEKVEMLRQTLEKSKEMYGENDKRTKEWTVKLNLAEAELNKMNNELKNNNSQMKMYGENNDKASASVKKLDSEVDTLKGNLDQIDTKYKKNKNSVEALQEKHEVLSNIMGKQSEKVEILKNALENSKNAYGKNSNEAKKLEKALSDAEGELKNTEHELTNVKTAMNNASHSSRTFKDTLKAMLSAEAITTGIRKLTSTFKDLKNYISDGVKSAANFGSEVSKLSRRTGISSETIQKFKAAARMTDVDVETFTKAYTRSIKAMSTASATLEKTETKAAEQVEKSHEKMAKAVDKSSKQSVDARKNVSESAKAMTDELISYDDALEDQMEKTSGVTKAYQELGVKIRDSEGNLRDAKTVFWETIDGLKNMGNETERNALAMQIFGKSAMDLNPIIEQGSAGFEDLTKNMSTFDDETIESLRGLEISMQKFGGVMDGIKRSLGVAFAPMVKEIADSAATAGGKLRGLFTSIAKGEDQETINKKFEEFRESIIKLAEDIRKQMPVFIEVGAKILQALWEGMVTAFEPILPQIAMWGVIIAGGFATWSSLISVAVTGITTAITAVLSTIPAIISAAITFWPVTLGIALAGLLVAFWPQIQEWSIKLWDSITNFFSQHWQDVLLWITSAPLAIIKTLNDLGIIAKVGEWLGGIWESIKNWFTDLGKRVSEWTSNVWNGFIKFLSELPSKIGYWLGFAIGSIVKFFKDCIDAFLKFIHKAWNFVTVDIPDIIKGIIDWFSKLPEKIWQWLSDTFTKIQTWGTKTVSEATTTGKNFLELV